MQTYQEKRGTLSFCCCRLSSTAVAFTVALCLHGLPAMNPLLPFKQFLTSSCFLIASHTAQFATPVIHRLVAEYSRAMISCTAGSSGLYESAFAAVLAFKESALPSVSLLMIICGAAAIPACRSYTQVAGWNQYLISPQSQEFAEKRGLKVFMMDCMPAGPVGYWGRAGPFLPGCSCQGPPSHSL